MKYRGVNICLMNVIVFFNDHKFVLIDLQCCLNEQNRTYEIFRFEHQTVFQCYVEHIVH